MENYKGRADQIKRVMECITGGNYPDMSQQVRNLESDDSVDGSNNISRFIKLYSVCSNTKNADSY